MEKLMAFSTAVHGFRYYKKYWGPVESECLDYAHEKENRYDYFPIKECQKDCWSSSNGNTSTNQISTLPRSTNHCDVDISVVLHIPACSRRPGDTLFNKGLHALHGEKQINHHDVRGNN